MIADPAETRLPWWVLGLLALFFTPVSIAVTGYGVYMDNHAMQVPLMQLLNNPGQLYAGDPFALSLLRYGAPLWHAVAAPVRWFGLERTLLTLFILNRLVAMLAVGMLAWAMRPGSRIGVLAAMAFMATAPEPMVGAGTLLERIFEHTTLAIGLFLCSFAALQTRRRWLWVLTWSAATWCNLMYGFFASLYLAARLAVADDLRREWRRWLAPLGVALALCVPLVLWALLTMKPGVYDRDVWLQVNTIRAEHHMNPYAWGAIDWLRFAALLAAVAWAARSARQALPAAAIWLWCGLCAALAWLAICVLAYHLRQPSLLLLHGARGTDLFYVLAGIGLLQLLIYRFESTPRLRLPWALAIFALPAFFNTHLLPWLALPLLVAVAWVTWRWLPVAVRQPALALALPLMAVPVAPMLEGLQDREGQWIARPDNDVARLARWARRETPADAIFLINPEWEEFRAIARRPVFVTWKDAGAIPWQRDYATVWVERMNALGADVLGGGRHRKAEAQAEMRQAWQHLDDARVLQLAAKYGIRYWIAPEDTVSRFPIVEGYGDSKVLAVPPTTH